MIMKMKYIKPVILCCYDIDMSIMTATADTETISGSGDGGNGSNVPVGDSNKNPSDTKGTSWNLWEDEGDDEEYSFY